MVETLFGSTSPMWTVPSVFPFAASMGIAGRPITAPAFAPAGVPSPGGVPVGGTFPVGLNPLAGIAAPIATDAGLSAASLLAVVAARRGQPQGPTTEQEVEDFIYDALELLPGASEVDVRCENGRATLTGTVQHKRVKRDAGEIAWAIPGLSDVQNNVTITSRRRARTAGRESEASAAQTRKQT
jgi:hypothetical protein